ncbi:MAG: hypothetical protein ACLVI9_05585 [Anaerostipes hadrus]
MLPNYIKKSFGQQIEKTDKTVQELENLLKKQESYQNAKQRYLDQREELKRRKIRNIKEKGFLSF